MKKKTKKDEEIKRKTGERIRQVKKCAMSNTKGEAAGKRNGAAARKPEAKLCGVRVHARLFPDRGSAVVKKARVPFRVTFHSGPSVGHVLHRPAAGMICQHIYNKKYWLR